jgi:hypothetical protein
LPRRTKIFVAPYLIDTDALTDTATDTEIDTDIDTDIDTNIDTDIDKDIDKDMDMELEYFCYLHGAIGRYSAVWITCDTSQRKFQQRYKLVGNFRMRIMTCLF